MKAGTFENNDSTPQSADKYNALRPNCEFPFPYLITVLISSPATPLAPQATGWGYQNPGFQSGFNGYR
jgi:hypothetical protein